MVSAGSGETRSQGSEGMGWPSLPSPDPNLVPVPPLPNSLPVTPVQIGLSRFGTYGRERRVPWAGALPQATQAYLPQALELPSWMFHPHTLPGGSSTFQMCILG